MTAGTVEIVIKGTLSPAFIAVFESFIATTDPHGLTHLVGWVPDQAKLHATLGLLRDLGIELVSVNQTSTPVAGRQEAPHTKE